MILERIATRFDLKSSGSRGGKKEAAFWKKAAQKLF
jgi:hypothetical protein